MEELTKLPFPSLLHSPTQLNELYLKEFRQSALQPIRGSYPKSVIEFQVFLMQRLARQAAGMNPRFI